MTTPLLVRQQPRRYAAHVWRLRLLLALCLAFFSEIFLWSDPTRPLWHWLPTALGYLLTATLLLDITVRFDVRDVFGLLLLAGAYATLAGALLNPAVSLVLLPDTLVTRVMGAQFVSGALGISLFLSLLSGGPRNPLLIGGVLSGAVWGAWARGYPLIADQPAASVTTVTLLVVAGVSLAILLLATIFTPRTDEFDASAVTLTRTEWIIVVSLLIGLAVLWISLDLIPTAAITPLVLILTYCLLVLWFQEGTQPENLLAHRLPPRRPNVIRLLAASVLFLLAGALTHQLLTTDTTLSLLSVLTAFYSFLGIAWLPAVSLVFGVRAYRQQDRTGKML